MVIYADCGSLEQIRQYAGQDLIRGFTTNPTIMKKAGITDYRSFAEAVLKAVNGKPVSFEVLADDFAAMEQQAREIASWAPNVYVKLPVTNTRGESTIPLIDTLGALKLNITAVMSNDQVFDLFDFLQPHHILSIFAGRIMDTGRLPPRLGSLNCKTLWASAREVYHVVMAEEYGYDIITLTPDLIEKLPLRGRDLEDYSLATVRQFHEDGKGIEF